MVNLIGEGARQEPNVIADTSGASPVLVKLPAAADDKPRKFIEIILGVHERHDDEEAAKLALLATEYYPRNASLLALRGNMYLIKGDTAKALEDHKAAAAIDPLDVWVINMQGHMHTNAGEFDEGIAAYTKVLAIDPKNRFALPNRAYARLGKGDAEGAEKDANASIAANPDYSMGYLTRALARLGRKATAEAGTDLAQVILMDPKNDFAYGLLGGSMYEAGQTDAAQAAYTMASKLKPAAPMHANGLGLCAFTKGDYATAYAQFDKAVGLAPKDPQLYRNRADAAEKRGLAEQAKRDRATAASLDKKK